MIGTTDKSPLAEDRFSKQHGQRKHGVIAGWHGSPSPSLRGRGRNSKASKGFLEEEMPKLRLEE